MDNALFRVNGSIDNSGGFDFLQHAVELAMRQSGYTGDNGMRPKGWSFSPDKGLVFYWSDPGRAVSNATYHPFTPMPGQTELKGITPAQTAQIIRDWLHSEQASEVKPERWCEDCDHDGHNGKGFLIYKEDWGRVGDCSYALFAVKPAFMWYGK